MTKAKTEHHVHLIVKSKQYNAWAAESQRTGVPMSELIRRAVDRSLNHQKEPKP